jgi:hypothetical protein
MNDDRVSDFGNTYDVFCNDLAKVERIGPVTRLTFTVPQECGNEVVNAVVAKLVIPTECLLNVVSAISNVSKAPCLDGEIGAAHDSALN